MATLPDLGMNGLVNSVRKITGTNNPGWRDVDPSATFIAGCVAKLGADVNGKPVLQTAAAADAGLIGLFYCHKTLSFYKPVFGESQTFGTAPNTASIIYLNNANIKVGSVYLSKAGFPVTSTGNWTLQDVNGTITRISGAIGATDTVVVNYLYKDPNLVGIDQTLGSGKAATIEDAGEVATLVYDTAKPYALMGNLYANADGYITSVNGTGTLVGLCTKVPTAEDPELHFKLKI